MNFPGPCLLTRQPRVVRRHVKWPGPRSLHFPYEQAHFLVKHLCAGRRFVEHASNASKDRPRTRDTPAGTCFRYPRVQLGQLSTA